MKFGKRLARSGDSFKDSAFAAALPNYKGMKKIIKRLANENPAVKLPAALFDQVAEQFTSAIYSEFSKVNEFYCARVEDCQNALSALRSKIACAPAEGPCEDLSSLIASVGDLRRFVVLSYLSFLKIVKKHDKNSVRQLSDRLMPSLYTQPFYNSHQVAGIFTELECLSRRGQDAKIEDFMCAICYDLLEAPVVLSCAHRFCLKCLSSASACHVNSACPTCRKPQLLDPANYLVDDVLMRFIAANFPSRVAFTGNFPNGESIIEPPPLSLPGPSTTTSPTILPSGSPLFPHVSDEPRLFDFDFSWSHAASYYQSFAMPKIEEMQKLNTRPWANGMSVDDKILLPWLHEDATGIEMTGASETTGGAVTTLAEQMAVFLDGQAIPQLNSPQNGAVEDYSGHEAFLHSQHRSLEESMLGGAGPEDFFDLNEGHRQQTENVENSHDSAESSQFLQNSSDPAKLLAPPLGHELAALQTFAHPNSSASQNGGFVLSPIPRPLPTNLPGLDRFPAFSAFGNSTINNFPITIDRQFSPITLPSNSAPSFRVPLIGPGGSSPPQRSPTANFPWAVASSALWKPTRPASPQNPPTAQPLADAQAAAGLALLSALAVPASPPKRGDSPNTANGKFACDHPGCEDSFNTRFSLKRHQKIHTKTRPFACSVSGCGKRFAEKSTLIRHERIHTGARPFKCNKCDKFFSDRTNMKRHERSHDKKTNNKRRKTEENQGNSSAVSGTSEQSEETHDEEESESASESDEENISS